MIPNELVSKASARVCLFGDHQDYLELPIIACAINRFIEMRGVANDSNMFQIDLIDMNSTRSFSINETFNILKGGDHIASVLRVLRRYDCVPTKGYTITVKGNIPINAGLSSSSAFVIAWIRFLLKAFGSSEKITDAFIAKVAHQAEVLEHKAPGGKMDHYSIALGDIIFLKTDASNEFVRIKKSIEGLIVAESGIAKNTVGLLGDLKENALKAIKMVQKSYASFDLHQAKLMDVEKYSYVLPKDLRPYFYAAIKNHTITQEAYVVLKEENIDYRNLGELMNQHHEVLRDSLKITTPKIDAMISAALEAGAYGAKIVGSGGGGSICVISPMEKQEKVISAIQEVSQEKAYVVDVVSV